ncbi:hypothetical protein [Hydrocarboniphaga effusa]|uniref:efflux RND transporter periplasmic adaptor subunit n=1 Tax=Hydrocarboniphaga effusa TaxID=243629 RepID=UPI0031382583
MAIEADETQQRRQYAGDVIAPAGGDGTYSRFPSATATDLLAISRAQIEADAQIQRAKAQLDVAKAIHQRAVQLLEEEAGSHLDRDRAQEQLDIAVANLRAAQSQRDLLGPAAVQLGEASSLWLRVPVFSGDLRDLDIAAPARIGEIGAPISEQQTEATPIKAPPSANSALSSVDLYFALPNTSGRFRIGQKLGVALSLRSDQKLTRIPWSAVIQDSHGGEWIYCRTAPQRYLRQRVQVAAVIGDHALLQRGPAIGTAVVVQGGLELFGIEFGVAH